jgi:hypothetical protein
MTKTLVQGYPRVELTLMILTAFEPHLLVSWTCHDVQKESEHEYHDKYFYFTVTFTQEIIHEASNSAFI